MDDGEFNLSNTIGIGLNIGEQMLLPVSNGEEEAQLMLQNQHEQHQQQTHYASHIDHHSLINTHNTSDITATTNVTCLDDPMGNYYQESPVLEDLNVKKAETTQIPQCIPEMEKAIDAVAVENCERSIVEELGSIAAKSKDNEHLDEDNKATDAEEKMDDKENEDDEGDIEDAEEADAEDVEGEELDGVEDIDEVEEIEEEIIPDEVIVTQKSQDAENPKKGESDNKDKNDHESAEEPTSSARAARKQEEEVDENQCRVCCSKENLVSIFKKVEQRTLAEHLMTLCPSVSIVIKDFLPQYICNMCCDNVAIAIKLKTQCETTEKELRKKLSRHKNKIRRPMGYVVIDAPLDSDPPTDEEPANDEEFKVSDIASATPSEDSDSSDFSDGKKKKTRGRKRRKSAVVTPTEGRKSKTKNRSDDQSSDGDGDDGDPIKHKRKRSSNSSPENFDCDECEQTFSRKQSLVLHKRQHTYDRGEPITCEVCGKKFKIRGAYRTHLEKHREERRSNKCSQCSRRFGSSSDLKRHIAEHHRQKIILPSCLKCNRTFSSAARLQRHKQNGCPLADASKIKKTETQSFGVGTDLFKAVAPLQTTYWSDSFSD